MFDVVTCMWHLIFHPHSPSAPQSSSLPHLELAKLLGWRDPGCITSFVTSTQLSFLAPLPPSVALPDHRWKVAGHKWLDAFPPQFNPLSHFLTSVVNCFSFLPIRSRGTSPYHRFCFGYRTSVTHTLPFQPRFKPPFTLWGKREEAHSFLMTPRACRWIKQHVCIHILTFYLSHDTWLTNEMDLNLRWVYFSFACWLN